MSNKDYFINRVKAVGIDPKKIPTAWHFNHNDESTAKTVDHPILWSDDKGNLNIGYTYLHGEMITYDKSESKSRSKITPVAKTRWHTPKSPDKKYTITKGLGIFPYMSPGVVAKYQKGAKIKKLVITEGEMKALAGQYLLSLDIIAIPGINAWGKAGEKTIFHEIAAIVKKCKVEEIIWLTDADTLEVVWKEGKDLYRRPYNFFQSVNKFRQYCKDFGVDLYFAHLKTGSQHKGLDDLAIALPKKLKQIRKELLAVSIEREYFDKMYVSDKEASKLKAYFGIGSRTHANKFYWKYEGIIDEKRFIYGGAEWQYDEETSDVIRKRSEEASQLMMCGSTWYCRGPKAVISRKGKEVFTKIFENVLQPIKWAGISGMFKHKKYILDNIKAEVEYYNGMMNVPGHGKDYQEEFTFEDEKTGFKMRYYNAYRPVSHVARDGSFKHIDNLVKHIFGEHDIIYKGQTIKAYDLGYDYIQLLWQNPRQELPILSLVSKQRMTAKTTFADFIRDLLQQNARKVPASELGSQFTSFYATSLLLALEEVKCDKIEIVEKIKEMVTSKRSKLEGKGKDAEEVDNWLKVLITSNQEDNFMLIDDDEVRFWVIKVNTIPEDKRIFDMTDRLRAEIPALLYYLEDRKMVTRNESRSWFHPELIKTDALQNVKNKSRWGVELQIEEVLRDRFSLLNKSFLQMQVKEVKAAIGSDERITLRQISKVVTDRWNIPRTPWSKDYMYYEYIDTEDRAEGHKHKGKYWTFYIDRFYPNHDYLKYIDAAELLELERQQVEDEVDTWWSKVDWDIVSQSKAVKYILKGSPAEMAADMPKMMKKGCTFKEFYNHFHAEAVELA